MELGRLAARGASITLLWQGGKSLLQLLGLVVLTRLLSPEDIGLVTIAVAIVGLANVIKDYGLAAGIMQAESITKAEVNNLLWANTFLGIILSAIVFASSPFVASFYENPKLIEVVRYLAPTFVLSSISSQVQAVLQRDLQFNRVGRIDFIAQLIGTLVSILIAVQFRDYRALVVQHVSTAALSAGLLLWAGNVRFSLPSRGVSVTRFLYFGANVSGTQTVAYLAKNIDNVIVGKLFGIAQAGLYGRAYSLVTMPLQAALSPLTRVALPILSRAKNQTTEYTKFLLDAQTIVVGTACVLYGSLAGFAQEIVSLLFGSRWIQAAPVIEWLCLGAIFRVLGQVPFWIFISHGLAKEQLRTYIWGQPIIIGFIIGGAFFGTEGIAAGSSLGLAVFWFHQMRASEVSSGLDLGPIRKNGLALFLLLGVPSYAIPRVADIVLDNRAALLIGIIANVIYLLATLVAWPALRQRLLRLVEAATNRPKG